MEFDFEHQFSHSNQQSQFFDQQRHHTRSNDKADHHQPQPDRVLRSTELIELDFSDDDRDDGKNDSGDDYSANQLIQPINHPDQLDGLDHDQDPDQDEIDCQSSWLSGLIEVIDSDSDSGTELISRRERDGSQPNPAQRSESDTLSSLSASPPLFPFKSAPEGFPLGSFDLNTHDHDPPDTAQSPRPRHPTATVPLSQPRLSPAERVEVDQAEMDRFFGFVPKEPEVMEMEIDQLINSSDEDQICEIVSDSDDDGGPLNQGPSSQAEPNQLEPAPRRQSKTSSRVKNDWVLEPVPRRPRDSTLEWTKPEKRVAIIEKLESMIFAVLDQLTKNAMNERTLARDDDQDSQPTSPGRSSHKRVVIFMAGRSGTVNSKSLKLRRMSWPRKTGQGEHVAGGGRDLAAFVRIIELILDGLRSNTISTKRELYYRDPKLFVSQVVVDRSVDDLAAGLGIRRAELNVIAATKGLFAGALSIITADGIPLQGGAQGALIPAAERIAQIDPSDAGWVLVAEKEAVFQSLCQPAFYRDGTIGAGIILTGKGYPDLATRELLRRLDGTLDRAVPLLALVDSDPHGIRILSTYKMGSSALEFDSNNLTVPRLEWLGVRGTEWEAMGVAQADLLPLTPNDRRCAQAMLGKDSLPEDWRRELRFMLQVERKAEIEVLSSAIIGSASCPPASQRSQGLPPIPLGSGSEDEGTEGSGSSQLMHYLFDKIGSRLSARAGEAEWDGV